MILTGLTATASFQKQSISKILSLLKYFKNVIKALEIINFLSYIFVVSLSLNYDLTKIR